MSLLLDALKKAALDKQHREQKIHTEDDAVDAQAANADVHALVSHDSSRSSHLSYDEGENSDDDENEEDLLVREFESEQAVDDEEEQLTFDVSEFETFTDESEPELTLEEREPVQEETSTELAYDRELNLVKPAVQASNAETLALAENPNQEQLERKQAMGRLIARNEEAIRQKKRQRLSLMILLAVISVFAVGLYYFYLKITLNSQSIYTPVQQTQLSSPVPEEDVLSEESASEESVSEESVSEESLVEESVVEESAANESPVSEPGIAGATLANKTAEEASTTETPATKAAAPIAPESVAEAGTAAKQKVAAAPAKKPGTAAETPITTPIATPTSGVISKSAAPPSQLALAIAEGFESWQRGDWNAAQQAYQRALSIDPNHRDAVLGAAAVAAQLGNEREALRLYQQRLTRAPRDEYALAGLLGLGNLQTEDGAMETELNTLLRDFPQAAHLHYLKGLLHAQRGQWNAAQGYFFDAWKLDANRPDYVFNLAVAMDHLALPTEALQFYKQARVLAQAYASNFSRQALEQRIAQLEAQSNSNTQQK